MCFVLWTVKAKQRKVVRARHLVNVRMVYLGEKPNLFQIIIIRGARAYWSIEKYHSLPKQLSFESNVTKLNIPITKRETLTRNVTVCVTQPETPYPEIIRCIYKYPKQTNLLTNYSLIFNSASDEKVNIHNFITRFKFFLKRHRNSNTSNLPWELT